MQRVGVCGGNPERLVSASQIYRRSTSSRVRQEPISNHNDHRPQHHFLVKDRMNDSLLLASLPVDTLLEILCYCDLFDVLNLSAVRASQFSWNPRAHLSQACTRLQKAVSKHEVWLHQAMLLQIPIPPGPSPSKVELNDWVVSRVKTDIRWIESLSGEVDWSSASDLEGEGSSEDGRRSGDDLVMHRFDFDEDPLLSAHYLPGGKFLVLLHVSGFISLERIEESVESGEWELCNVARYHRRITEGRPARFSNEILNEVSHGRCFLAYTVEEAQIGMPTIAPTPSAPRHETRTVHFLR